MSERDRELLKSGLARAIITPPVGFNICGPEFAHRRSIGIDDDLLAKCVVLESYGFRAVLIAIDAWGLTPELRAEIADSVSRSTDIHAHRVVIFCTGNGSSPPLWHDRAEHQDPGYRAYLEYLPHLMAGIAQDALNRMTASAASADLASLPNVSCFYHGYRDADVEAERERLPVMVVEDSAGAPMVLLASFACPATVLGNAMRWSADYPGVACWAMERSGAEMGVFIQGASGGVRPFDWWADNECPSHPKRGNQDAQALGIILATQAAQCAQKIQPRRNAIVKAVSDSASGMQALRVGDGIFFVADDLHSAPFATGLRERFPDYALFISANRAGGGLAEIGSPEDVAVNAAINLIEQVVGT